MLGPHLFRALQDLRAAGLAVICWQPADAQTLRPTMSDKAAAEWLADHAGDIEDGSIEHGWAVIEALLGPPTDEDMRLLNAREET